MTNMIADPIAAAIEILSDDSELLALVSRETDGIDPLVYVEFPAPRIYGIELPRGYPTAMPVNTVLLKSSGGGSIGPGASSRMPWSVTRLDIHCYGLIPEDAFEVYLAVNRIMVNIERRVASGCIVHDAVITGGPITSRDVDTDWPFTLGVYDLSTVPLQR